MNLPNKGLVYRGPSTTEVVELPEPEPKEGEVVFEVAAVGICGSDVHGSSGDTGRRQPGAVMGHEMVGYVLNGAERDGPYVVNPVVGCGQCARCRAGRTQHCAQRWVLGVDPTRIGGFARRLALPASALIPFDGPVDLTLGALVEPLAVGLHGVGRLDVKAGDSVLVLGSGMIGLAAAWSALQRGARPVIATDLEPTRLEVAQSMGAIPVDIRESGVAEALQQNDIVEADWVVDAVGTSETLSQGLRVLKPDGALCLVGMAAPVVELKAYELVTLERTILGSWCYSTPDFADAADAISSGFFSGDLIIDNRVALDDAPLAFSELIDGTKQSIKTLILPNLEA